MGMQKPPPPPKPAPVEVVPQEDDPASVEAMKKQAIKSKAQDGVSAHLLNGEQGITEDPGTKKKTR